MALRAIWPEVPWTICYIILNTCKSVRRHVLVIVYLRQKTSSDKIRNKTLYWSGPVNMQKYWPVQYYTIIVFCIDTKDCNCFITLKWKVKVKPSQYEINDVIHNAMESESESESIRVLIKQYQILRNVRWQHDSL